MGNMGFASPVLMADKKRQYLFTGLYSSADLAIWQS
uniref:Uncharacterized protein n=1 Tax=Anguilla anguilla TaxID=7936 RepID=A0A0E9TCW6_ANGAN